MVTFKYLAITEYFWYLQVLFIILQPVVFFQIDL